MNILRELVFSAEAVFSLQSDFWLQLRSSVFFDFDFSFDLFFLFFFSWSTSNHNSDSESAIKILCVSMFLLNDLWEAKNINKKRLRMENIVIWWKNCDKWCGNFHFSDSYSRLLLQCFDLFDYFRLRVPISNTTPHPWNFRESDVL